MPELLTSWFKSSETLRSRSVSDVLLSGVLDVPTPPARLVADWERDIALQLQLQPGDVEALSLARTRAKWPEYASCVQAVTTWTRKLGLAEVLAHSDVALMACRGARYHHDGAQYGGSAFCNLFLSEDRGLDLYFPVLDRRIALTRGTAVIFDTCQPHAVVRRGSCQFNPADFGPGTDCSQLFLTWELPMEDASVARELHVSFDIDVTTSHMTEEQVYLNGGPAVLDQDSGLWCKLA